MAIYIPNMDSKAFEEICKEKGLQFIYISVQPHGRLVDADKIHFTGEYGGKRVTTKSLIDAMPTVIPAESETKTCYNCFWGGDGEEIDDCGHCWLHNGEADFEQPPKDKGCGEWKPKEGVDPA